MASASAIPIIQKELPFRDKERKNPILHPRVIFEGVRQGVEHGGNKSGHTHALGLHQF